MSAGHTCPPMKYFAKEGEETITRTEFDERIAARRRCKLTKDRNLPDQHSECFYYEFTPGVALNAAKKVEKRKDIYRRNQRDRERFADDAAKDRAINRKIFWALLASPTASFLVNLPILLFGTDIG